MLYLKKYENQYKKAWDSFVLDKSINGTFLQTRQFIEYHPEGRFKDASFFIEDEKGHIVAAVLACEIMGQEQKVLFSHKGTTFGGLLVSEKYYKADKLNGLLDMVEEHLKSEDYAEVVLKQTSKLFSKCDGELIEYMLVQRGFLEKLELSSYIDFADYKADVKSNFSQGKRTHVNNAQKYGWKLWETAKEEEIEAFYSLLCDNLDKYKTKPIHTYDELLLLKNRLGDTIRFFVLKSKEKIIAGAMIFVFENTNTVHLQYSCADKDYEKQSAMTYLYYCLIKLFMDEKKKYFSFGISTEEQGKILNYNLLKSKEQYGSKTCVNRTFVKEMK